MKIKEIFFFLVVPLCLWIGFFREGVLEAVKVHSLIYPVLSIAPLLIYLVVFWIFNKQIGVLAHNFGILMYFDDLKIKAKKEAKKKLKEAS